MAPSAWFVQPLPTFLLFEDAPTLAPRFYRWYMIAAGASARINAKREAPMIRSFDVAPWRAHA
jgi:hypothetical protein